jgi:uncharacterized protein (DUF2384 family)
MNKEEILEFGLTVFNNEIEKFNHWLKNTNMSIGNVTPESLLNSEQGLKEVEKCLYRIEYGNFA